METFIPYSLNLGIRDRDRFVHHNLGPYANILKLIISNSSNQIEQENNENLVVFRGLKLQ
jgi:hypothetical protein